MPLRISRVYIIQSSSIRRRLYYPLQSILYHVINTFVLWREIGHEGEKRQTRQQDALRRRKAACPGERAWQNFPSDGVGGAEGHGSRLAIYSDALRCAPGKKTGGRTRPIDNFCSPLSHRRIGHGEESRRLSNFKCPLNRTRMHRQIRKLLTYLILSTS